MSDIETPVAGDRLQKIIAQAGLASRRDAEELIRDGKVTVNGKTAKLGDKATLGKDSIKVKGKLIQSTEQKVYYLIYKPKNVISMLNEDEEGRATLREFTKRIPERVFTVGKMDFTGEGAILLTNDGEIAQKMQKANDIIRRYHVKVDRHPTPLDIEKLSRGGRMDGKSMNPYHVRLATAYNRNALIEISFEGMSSIDIRKFFENKGFYPERIAVVGIGHINAEKMTPGTLKRLEGSSVEALFSQPELAKKQIEKLVAKRSHFKTVNDEDGENTETSEVTIVGKVRKEGGERPAKRFGGEGRGAPRAGARTTRTDTRAPRGASTREAAFGDRAPRVNAFGDRPARGEGRPAGRSSFGSGDRPARGGFGADRAPRGERPARGGFGADRAPRGDRPSSNFGDRPARSFGGDRPARGGFGSDRPARGGFGSDRPARGGFGGDRSAAPRGDSRGPRATSSFGGERSERRPSFGRSGAGARPGSSRAPSAGGRGGAARPTIRAKRA
jgi:23S rRNA pseudouridine2605 synthase